MESSTRKPNIVKVQRILIYITVAIFIMSMVINFISEHIGMKFNYIAVIFLFLAAPIRMIWVGEYFRMTNQKKYQALAYIVIGIIALTVLLRLLLQNV